MENRTGIFTNMIIWFGVAISVSEIQAGIQIGSAAPINSIWVPLILGHVIGGVLLYFVGLIGARLRVNAMESIKSTFGNFGSRFFAMLNVLQLTADHKADLIIIVIVGLVIQVGAADAVNVVVPRFGMKALQMHSVHWH